MIRIINQVDDAYWVDKLLNRSQLTDETVNQTVEDIINDVRKNQDEALKYYTEKFDKVRLEELLVSEEDIDKAFESSSDELISDLKRALENIKRFHEAQRLESFTIKD
ncbi:MAG: histidinol dehydrogenase, partial [Candidatus Izemoplasmataceae bacterium]